MSNTRDEIKILLAESNKEDRESLLSTLSKYFSNIIESDSGKNAFSIYQEDKSIDIIIANSNLPDLAGLDFLGLVRQQDLHIPFIITTKDINSEKLLKAIDLNVSAFLPKPISIGKLLEKVDIFSEQRMLEKRLLSKRNEIRNYINAVDKVSVIFKMKEDGRITYMNKIMQEVSGYDKDEIENLNFENLIHPDIPKKYIEDTWEQIKNNNIWKGNTKFISKEGQDFYLNNSVFSVNEKLIDDTNEFITIAFLTTKENLEKRDFHRKVILNIKEANEREYILNQKLKKISTEYTEKESQLNLAKDSIQKLEIKIKQKENQIKKDEKEIIELNEKYDKMLLHKREEVEYHINLSQTNKLKFDKISTELKDSNEKVEMLTEKYTSALEDINSKNRTIQDLRDIINPKE